MTKILLLGHLSPELCGQAKIEAANYRTGQFLQPLLGDGHTVCLCVPPVPGASTVLPPAWQGQLTVNFLDYARSGWRTRLQAIANRFQPDCVVAVNFDACLYATRLRVSCPIWMDIYGDIITIMQSACYRAQSNRGMPTTLSFVKDVLQKADKVSVCSNPQRHMAVGELSMIGRLNWETFGYEFTEVIPAGMLASEPSQDLAALAQQCRAENHIPERDFIVLWCGGYNTWTDVNTLFQGLECAMQSDPNLHYLSVGASTYSAPGNVYDHFQEMVNQSPYRERYHLLGWQPWSSLSKYYAAANVGLNIDAIHYETIYGTRTRLMEMIAYKIPIITSLGTELSYLLHQQQAALTFEIGSWQQLGDQMVNLAFHRPAATAMAQRALQYAKAEFSFETTTQGLRQWVQKPALAPDHITAPRTTRHWANASHTMRSLVRRALWKTFGLDK